MWLAEQLRELERQWKAREDVSPRAHEKVKFAREIETLELFGKRGYSDEMNTQKTVIKDLLGG
jgi:centromere/kinetochore protein ZW10